MADPLPGGRRIHPDSIQCWSEKARDVQTRHYQATLRSRFLNLINRALGEEGDPYDDEE